MPDTPLMNRILIYTLLTEDLYLSISLTIILKITGNMITTCMMWAHVPKIFFCLCLTSDSKNF